MSLDVNMNCHIVVDDLPNNILPEKKEGFLRIFKKKITDTLGKAPLNVTLADDSNGLAIAAFIKLSTPAEADAAIAKLHGLAFTKTCTFSAYRWGDFEKAQATPDTYEPPAEDSAEGGDGVRDMTNQFLLDDKCRPQLIIKAGEQYDVQFSYLNTKNHTLDQIVSTASHADKAPWSELDKRAKKLQRPSAPGKKPFPQWTARGTYLISQNASSAGGAQQVLKFWGGNAMQLCAEVTYHAGELQDLIISNTEKFAIVKSKGISFWNLAEGKLIRQIVRGGGAGAASAAAGGKKGGAAAAAAASSKAGAAAAEEEDEDENISYQYNSDDTLVGGVTRTAAKQGIALYNAKTMKLVTEDVSTKMSQVIAGVHSVAFSPTNAKMFAYVVEDAAGWRVHVENVTVKTTEGEQQQQQQVPVFQSLCKRSWSGVTHIGLLWHPSGDFLAARMTKQQGDHKKVEYCIFRTHTNNVSAELFDPKGEARRFVFQPNAPRFALLVVPSGQTALIKRQYLQFFHIEPRVGIRKVTDVMSEADRVMWAPKGSRCVAINIDKSQIEFYGVQGGGPFQPAPGQEMVRIQERNSGDAGSLPNSHPCPTDFDWDPTGRYFMSITSALTHDVDNLLSIWNVNGRIVFQQPMKRLSHAAFRPMPRTLLSEPELQRVRKELPKKSAEYDARVREEQAKAQEAVTKKREKVEARYLDIMNDVHNWHQENNFAERRLAAYKSAPSYLRQMEQVSSAAQQQ